MAKVLDKNVSFYVTEDGETYTYQTVMGAVMFKVPKWILFSPRFNGGVIPNASVAKYIISALDEMENA